MGNPKRKHPGTPDAREKARTLTEAEKRRLTQFENLSDELLRQGYRRSELTVGIVSANVFGAALLVPLAVIGLGLFYLKNRSLAEGFGSMSFLWVMLVFAVLIPVHELIHGISWAVFAKHHFKDIEFGFMKQYLTPYCTCKVPLSKGQYLFGALMPLILLGILPMIAGILIGSMPMLLTGILMADAASGDIMIAWKVVRYKSRAADVLYIDHPTQAGGVVFEK